MTVTRKFIANTKWAAAAKAISGVLAVPFFIILGRSLGESGLGLFSSTLSVLVFARILSGSGLGHSTGRLLAELAPKKADSQSRGVLTAGLLIQTATGLSAALGMWVFAGHIGLAMGNQALIPMLRLGAAALFFFALTEFIKAALQGAQRFDYLTVVTTVEFGGKLAFAGGLAWSGRGPAAALGGFAAALALAAAAGLICLKKVGLGRPASGGVWREIVAYSLPLMLTSAGFVIYAELDNIMLFYYHGAAAAGLYTAALNIARALPQLAVPLGQAAAPVMAAYRQADSQEAADFVQRLIKYLLALFFLIAALVFILAEQLLPLFGPKFVDGAPALRVMAVFVLSLSLGSVIAPMVDYLGEAPRRAMWLTITVSINVVLNFLLIPLFGGVGAAAATALTHTPYVLNNLFALSAKVGLARLSWLPIGAAVAGAGFLAAGPAYVVIGWRASPWLAAFIWTVAYLAGLRLFGLISPAEISRLIKAVAARTPSTSETRLREEPVNQ